MKRKMLFSKVTDKCSCTSYTLLNQDDGTLMTECQTPRKALLCSSARRRMCFLLILVGVVLLWVGIYYKLLNHKFDLPEPFTELRRIFGDGPSKKRKFREFETENVDEVYTHLPERLHIAIVACNRRLDEALVSLKSITLITNYNLYFHIFTDRKSYEKRTFDETLTTWPAYKQRWMTFSTYVALYPDSIEEDVQDHLEELFKPCASYRLFLANANSLPGIDSVLYVDTDTLFLQPPEELWKHFTKFSGKHIAGLTMDCQKGQKFCWYTSSAKHPFVKPYGVNTGVMLMNLTRMRHTQWERELVEIFRNNRFQLRFGDQDLVNIYFHAHWEQLYIVPCNWNYRPEFCMLEEDNGNLCKEADKNGISLLHGSRSVFQKEKLQPEFKVIYDVYRKYKFEKEMNHQEKIVNTTLALLHRKFLHTSCGRVIIKSFSTTESLDAHK